MGYLMRFGPCRSSLVMVLTRLVLNSIEVHVEFCLIRRSQPRYNLLRRRAIRGMSESEGCYLWMSVSVDVHVIFLKFPHEVYRTGMPHVVFLRCCIGHGVGD